MQPFRLSMTPITPTERILSRQHACWLCNLVQPQPCLAPQRGGQASGTLGSTRWGTMASSAGSVPVGSEVQAALLLLQGLQLGFQPLQLVPHSGLSPRECLLTFVVVIIGSICFYQCRMTLGAQTNPSHPWSGLFAAICRVHGAGQLCVCLAIQQAPRSIARRPQPVYWL